MPPLTEYSKRTPWLRVVVGVIRHPYDEVKLINSASICEV